MQKNTLSSTDPAARLAERQHWISSEAEQSAQNAIRSGLNNLGESTGLGGATLRSALHGDWLHEPLHAVLTDIPIGAWTAAVVFDALGAVAKNEKMDAAADASVMLGLAGAVGSAVTGMNDWSEIKAEGPRRIGTVHALLNIGATALFAGSCFARRRRGCRATARSLAIVGFIVVSLSAHLGGNLVYEHGIGVAPPKGA